MALSDFFFDELKEAQMESESLNGHCGLSVMFLYVRRIISRMPHAH